VEYRIGSTLGLPVNSARRVDAACVRSRVRGAFAGTATWRVLQDQA
jgi:hypothetical protein